MFMDTHLTAPSAHPGDSEAGRKPASASSEAISRLSGSLIGARAAAGLAETFKALGDLTRVRMLDALSRSEL